MGMSIQVQRCLTLPMVHEYDDIAFEGWFELYSLLHSQAEKHIELRYGDENGNLLFLFQMSFGRYIHYTCRYNRVSV